jgi:hypothetical protein
MSRSFDPAMLASSASRRITVANNLIFQKVEFGRSGKTESAQPARGPPARFTMALRLLSKM